MNKIALHLAMAQMGASLPDPPIASMIKRELPPDSADEKRKKKRKQVREARKFRRRSS